MKKDNDELLKITDFSDPYKVFDILTSFDIEYDKLTEFAVRICDKIKNPHVNKDGRKFHGITQGILECFKIMRGFKSEKWISEKNLNYELKPGEDFITFSRTNAKGEECIYKIANFDQIDFDREIIYADEFEMVSKPEKPAPVVRQDTSQDDKVLRKVINFLRNGDNVFITGHAGTGKSYILGKLKEKYKKKLTITSTTGIAAVNVKGQTLHSWSGVGLCRNTIAAVVDKIKTRPAQLRQIKRCKMLAIDEISMLNIETFEYVNEVLKQIRETDEPFGGIQVIFIGDFFQLPPVEKDNPEEKHYCFESLLWQDLNLKNVILTKNYRQSEEGFIKALSNMRINNLTEDDIDLLSSREVDIDSAEANMLHIFSTNEEANAYNMLKFNALDNPVSIFRSKDGVFRGKNLVYDDLTERENAILNIFNKNCRAENEIILKKGCRVMLLVNMDFEKGLINGACGTVEEFGDTTINITFDSGVNSNIPLHEFEYYYNDEVIATRLQFPLKLAYGITIHKSQGMTLDKLVVDCKRIFERGQIYVAMSRVKTLDGLYLKHFDADKVLVDSKVAEFYKNLENSPEIELPDDFIPEYEYEKPEPISDKAVVDLVLACTKEFNGQYGKSGISKILTGSKSIKENDYNQKILASPYYGIIKGRTRKSVDEVIDTMIAQKLLTIKKVSFGRPLLCYNKGL